MLRSLEQLCAEIVVNWIFEALSYRKKRLSKCWIMDITEWIKCMRIEDIRNYIEHNCIGSTSEILLTKSISSFQDSRYHDILMCCYHLFAFGQSIYNIIIPECLKMDQQHRSYLLKILSNHSNIKKIDFQCFSGNTTFYVSDQEQYLLKSFFARSSHLILIKLPNIANNEIIQAIKNTCLALKVLILSPNKSLNDESANILAGTHTFVIKGPLKTFKKIENPKYCETIKLLDIKSTSISVLGHSKLTKFLPHCTIIV